MNAQKDIGIVYRYWGKASKVDGSYHLLPYHCLDVAAVAQTLLQHHHYLRKSLAELTGLDETVFIQWMTFFIALHDLGKFSQSFQNLRPDLLQLLQYRTIVAGYSLRHDSLGYMVWRKRILTVLQENGWISSKGRRVQNSVDYWAMAVTGHHGQPPKIQPGHDDYFSTVDCDAAVSFALFAAELFLGDKRILIEPDITKSKQASWWLSGFAVLCDWLGSNPDYFPYRTEQLNLSDYWDQIQKQANKAVVVTELLPVNPAPLQTLQNLFSWESEYPTPLQTLCTGLRFDQGANLFILEDVTGAGKTEGALMLAHRMMSSGQSTGIYFALPTMATANAMYGRMAKVYKKLFQTDAKPSLILTHGARDLSARYRQSLLPESEKTESENGDGTTPASIHCSAWLADNRKKALLAEIGIGTVDQALLAILPSRHQSLRLLGLLGKVLLVDEVHACDAYMNQLLCALLKAHAAGGGSAILLSATLPQTQRQALVDAFSQGRGWQVEKVNKTDETDYPLLTHRGAGGIYEEVVLTRESVRRNVTVELLHSEAGINAKINDAIEQGKCVCWIRNTVGHARHAYATLTGKFPHWSIDLFHARFAMADRLTIEDRIIERFGPTSTPQQRRGQLLIATQVVEQSLDLDFDLMVTDLAPVDLIIQRAGRLCRHSRDEQGNRIADTDRRGVPTLIINTPSPDGEPTAGWFDDYFPKAGSVYPHHGHLWLTAKLLSAKGGFRMPDDARALIEGVYDASEFPVGLQQRIAKADGEDNANRSLGVLNSLKLEPGFGGGDENIWWDEAVTPTRLGEATTMVYLARWQDGHLSPWVQNADHRWARSAVQISRALIAEEASHDDIPPELIAECREALPCKGKWGVLLPLIDNGNGLFCGKGKDANGLIKKVFYSLERGIEI